MEYVDNKRLLPPPELELGWNMQSFGGLPETGSALDQPVRLMRRIKIALNYYKVWSAYRSLKGGDMGRWIQANPGEWKMVKNAEEIIKNG